MRVFLSGALFAALLAGLTPAFELAAQEPAKKEDKPKAKAKKYTDKEGGFAVTFPGKVTKQTKKVESPAGELEIKLAIHAGADNTAFIIIYNNMPEGTKDADPKQVLDGAQQGALQKGTLVSKKDVKFGPDKLPAREVVMDNTTNGMELRFRILMILTGDRLYQVLVGGADEFGDDPKAKEFIKSFELLPRKVED